MKRPLLITALASLLAVPAAVAGAPSEFSAVIRAKDMQSAAGAAGIATFQAEDHAIRYSVDLAGFRQITNVILLVHNRALNLYAGPATENQRLAASGLLTEGDLDGLSLADVVKEMESGRARVTVFTVELADGSISGNVRATTDLKVPEIRVPDVRVTPTT